MAESSTLLAYLVPTITPQVEVAATKALAYILNNSASARGALVALIEKTGSTDLKPIAGVVAEDPFNTEGGDGRIDFVGYDDAGGKRLVGEAKFNAALSPGQGGGYLHQLARDGNAVLLFVVPAYRVDYLWEEVKKDVADTGRGANLADIQGTGSARSARVEYEDTNWSLMMLSWNSVLQTMHESTVEEPAVQADIRQLLGLTKRLDREAVLPFGKEELSPQFGRRVRDLMQIYYAVLDLCKAEEWISWGNRNPTYRYGFGNNCQLSGVRAWFGLYHLLWAQGDCYDTPFWVTFYDNNQVLDDAIRRKLDLPSVQDRWNHSNFPIRLRTGFESPEVVKSIVSQLQEIAKVIVETTADTAQP